MNENKMDLYLFERYARDFTFVLFCLFCFFFMFCLEYSEFAFNECKNKSVDNNKQKMCAYIDLCKIC